MNAAGAEFLHELGMGNFTGIFLLIAIKIKLAKLNYTQVV